MLRACKGNGRHLVPAKKLPFQDGGEAGVYEHLKRAMQYMINDAGAHGIPRIRYADWNDALNIDDPEAESVFMAMAMAWACKELAALSRFLGDNAYALQLLEQRAALVETINRKAWDGEWYLRAFSKFGPVGSKSSPTGGNIYINPQVWSILADVVPEDRLDAVLTAIDKMDKNTASSSVSPPTRTMTVMSAECPACFWGCLKTAACIITATHSRSWLTAGLAGRSRRFPRSTR